MRCGGPSRWPPAASRRSRASRARRRRSTSGPPGSCRSTASSTTKLRMLAAFTSQAHRDYMDPELVRATARYWSRFGDGHVRRAAGDDPGVRDAARARGTRRGRDRGAGRRARGALVRVLVTGAGGPAGVAVIRSLLRRGDVEVFAADMDRWASALYLVDAPYRRLVPAGKAPDFVDVVRQICADDAIDVLFPTVDVELPAAGGGPRRPVRRGPRVAVADHARDLPRQARARAGLRADGPGAPDRAARHAAGDERLGLPGDRQAAPRRRLAGRADRAQPGRARRRARRGGPDRPGDAPGRRVLGRRARRAWTAP